MATNRYCIDIAKRGTAGCKECNQKIDKGCVRIAKIIPNPFTESGGEMKQWFHVKCAFTKLSRARATTKKIESTDDLEGWEDIPDEHRDEVLKCLAEFSTGSSSKKTPQKKSPKTPTKKESNIDTSVASSSQAMHEKDNSFRAFRKVLTNLAEENKYTEKTAIMKKFFTKGSDGDGFKGDLYLWVKLLLPNVDKRVYNLQSKQLVKLFSDIFNVSSEEMLEDLEQGDVAKTIATFFEDSSTIPPCSKSTLSLQDVDKYLDELTIYSKEAEQTHILKKVAKKCTANDLQVFVRLIVHDLKINAGPKPVLDAIHPDAYEAFQASRDLKTIISDAVKSKGGALNVQSSLMTPVLPMLAQACKSVSMAFEKCPNGFFVEIKYDGERVQVHKRGSEFSYFSRSLKPVMPHKINHFKEYIPQAFPRGDSLIIDSEILLVSKDGIPLPFGTLGAHKKTAFKDATVCLYVFDILQFNEENLMKRPLCERREILRKNMTEVKNHVMFSEMKEINDPKELRGIINSVIKQGLEGLVIKDKMSVYEPGKRHWLKVKRDYLEKSGDLEEGTMPDTVDLVVLGAYYGTGKYGGMKSIFLMGCLDENSGKWCTVTKVRGFKDDELEELQDLKMTKISKNPDLVPSNMRIKKALVPDFIFENIKDAPVWEIMGTEFSKADAHTANGISIRFPRFKCVRDKTWKQSTTLARLQELYDLSKTTADRVGLEIIESSENEDDTKSSRTSDESPEKSASRSKSRKRPSEEDTTPSKKAREKISDVSSPKSVKRPSEESATPSKKGREKLSDESSSKSSKSPSEDNWSPLKKAKNKHSSESSNSPPLAENGILCDVFSGVKLNIPPSIKDADILRRYFVSYDGILLKENQADEATVVIVTDKDCDAVPQNAEKVTVDWLWACIKLKKKVPTKLYKPK